MIVSVVANWIEYIIIDILWNVIKIKVRKKKPNYLGAFCRRVLVGFVNMLILHPEFDPVGNPVTILYAAPFVIFEVTSFYLTFDPTLNWFLGRKWYYKGSESGYLDSLPMWAYYSVKVLCLAGLPYSLIQIL